MKIVRLTSDEKTAMFDNTFNDDITIKEKSRVALHSITTETAPSVVDLTAANNQMNIQIQTGSIYTPTIAPGVYNSGNNSVLFKDIGDKINEELDGNKIIGDATSFPSGAQVGMMFKCDVGASTNPDPEVFAYVAAQVKDCMEATMRLGGQNYVLWGGREGYETILNTNMKLEMDNLSRFLELVVNHKHKIGFKGQILLEPKPHEPTKHQYDFDSASCIP